MRGHPWCPTSVFDNLSANRTKYILLKETADDGFRGSRADLTQRVSDGEDKQEILEGSQFNLGNSW